MKRTSALIAVVAFFGAMLLFLPPRVAQAAIPTFEEAVIVADDVNMRLRPTVESPVVLKMVSGTRVGVFCEEQDGWYRIVYGNYRGYVSTEFVFLPSTDVLVGNVINDDTPVYQNAGEYSERIDTLTAGMGVSIIGIQPTYYYIEYSEDDKMTEAVPESQPGEGTDDAAAPTDGDEATADTDESGAAEQAEPSADVQAQPDVAEPDVEAAEPGAVAQQEQPVESGAPEPDTTDGAEDTPAPESTADTLPTTDPGAEDVSGGTGESGGNDEGVSFGTDEAGADMKRGYITKDAVRTSNSKNAAKMIREGMTGVEVVKLQSELKKRGFLVRTASGEFDEATKKAVTLFQEYAEIAADGVAGAQTLELLYGDNDIHITFAQRMGLSDPVELVPWTEVDANYIPKETVYTVMDVYTGITWQEYRFGGWYHADTVPYTAEDTAKMKQAVGEWTWERRPIWIIMDDVNIAASMNCMPHLSNVLPENNFGGHHCIHFYQSKVHETSRECPRHAAAVQNAYKMGQELS